MKHQDLPRPGRRIAVIGGGISGMGAAHALATDNHVTLFEAEPRLGGHARTRMAGPEGTEPVDTGFLVFNYVNYPRMAELFAELDVPVTKSNMSFAASLDDGRFEYGLSSLDTVFARRSHIVSPRFWRLIRDVLRFNARGVETSRREPGMTIGRLLELLGTGKDFRDRYLLPFSGAIWSTPTAQILEFPAEAMLRFFENHHLLNLTGQHQWYTVDGCSIEYVGRLQASMAARGVDLRLGAPVQGVRRMPGGAEVRPWGGEWERFDEVVFATHSDDTLRLLSDPTEEESAVLGAIGYQPNRVVLHSDPAVMPRRRKVWSSWNFVEMQSRPTDAIPLTYWINALQPWPKSRDYFVTLNATQPIREDLIWDECVLRHPVYDLAALEAQQKAREMNGKHHTWVCGAWMKNGFHEDGLASALEVVDAMRAGAVQVAAE